MRLGSKARGPCVVWLGYRNPKGYGLKWFRGALRTVHRIVWTLINGDIPPGMFVLHRCDNPPCFRIDHLFLGTTDDNARDCMLKGRRPKGEAATFSKMTEEDVRHVRIWAASGYTLHALSAAYGFGATTIRHAIHGITWSHVK